MTALATDQLRDTPCLTRYFRIEQRTGPFPQLRIDRLYRGRLSHHGTPHETSSFELNWLKKFEILISILQILQQDASPRTNSNGEVAAYWWELSQVANGR